MRWMVVIGILLILAGLALPAFGQGLEELARQRIAEETGLDEDLIATIFVSEDDAQFILTFIYIEDRTFDSHLKPELLEAIAPYRNREAMLVLVTPARESYFNPLSISFIQNRISYNVRPTSIRRIDESFAVGMLPAGEVSSGVILLDRLESGSGLLPGGLDLDVNRPFQISYMGYTTDFALSPGEPFDLGLGVSGEESASLLQLFFFTLLNFLLLLLLSFLVV
jgi:hypothetical protein